MLHNRTIKKSLHKILIKTQYNVVKCFSPQLQDNFLANKQNNTLNLFITEQSSPWAPLHTSPHLLWETNYSNIMHTKIFLHIFHVIYNIYVAIVLPEVESDCSLLQNQYSRGKVGGKERLLYLREQQLGGRVDLWPKINFPLTISG